MGGINSWKDVPPAPEDRPAPRGLKWNGGIAAVREYAQACRDNPPRPKPGKPGKRKRKNNRQRRACPKPPAAWANYGEYLLTAWWRNKRRQKLESVGGKCERCRRPADVVHHKHYRTLGREKNADLEALCRPCHDAEHECLIQAESHLAAIARGA